MKEPGWLLHVGQVLIKMVFRESRTNKKDHALAEKVDI